MFETLEHLNFGFVSNFEIWISDFRPTENFLFYYISIINSYWIQGI
jgi:hypothetical protein